jgi:hypothetical protein
MLFVLLSLTTLVDPPAGTNAIESTYVTAGGRGNLVELLGGTKFGLM